MVVRNVSDQTVCNVAGFGAELVRNVAEHVSSETVRNVPGQLVSNVGGFKVRNVSDSGSGMVPDVVGHGANFMSLHGRCWTIAHPHKLLAST